MKFCNMELCYKFARYVLSYQQNRQTIHVRRNTHWSNVHVRDYVILDIPLKNTDMYIFMLQAIAIAIFLFSYLKINWILLNVIFMRNPFHYFFSSHKFFKIKLLIHFSMVQLANILLLLFLYFLHFLAVFEMSGNI